MSTIFALVETAAKEIPIFEKSKAMGIKDISMEKLDMPISGEVRGFLPIEGNGGTWEGERGNSKWTPMENYVPENKWNTEANPDNLTLKEIFAKYGIESIEFKDGYPDFTPVSKGDVSVEMTEKRYNNFKMADEALAKEKGCTPEEVKKWREENNYTWHEHQDGKTMQKVPNEVHASVPHAGGISVIKRKEAEGNE